MERYIKSTAMGALIFILIPQISFAAVNTSVPATLTLPVSEVNDEIVGKNVLPPMTGDNTAEFIQVVIAVCAAAIIIYMALRKVQKKL